MNSKDSFTTQNIIAEEECHSPGRLFPHMSESCELTLTCPSGQFSASRIAHAVEDAEAHLLNLNVTSLTDDAGQPLIDIRVSHRNGGSVASSLDRYGYTVVDMRNAIDAHAESAAERIGNLMSQLNV